VPNDLEFDLSDPRFLGALEGAGLSVVVSVGVLAFGLAAFVSLVPRTRAGERLSMSAEITANSGGALEASRDLLVGRHGLTHEALRPSGTVFLDGEGYSARMEHGGFAAAGAAVEVIAVEFGELVVRLSPQSPENPV